jgi:hypothetical protein
MSAEAFAEWLRRQGHRVVRSESSSWYDAGPHVLQSFPYHARIEPSEDELRQLLRSERALALRYSTPLSAADGRLSYHGVRARPYSLEALGANARSTTRRGLKRCRVEPITIERLASDGWELQADTLDRQGRSGSLARSDWERLCRAAADLPSFEAWGALVDDQLAATILVATVEGVPSYLYPQSHRRFFADYPNNALAFALTDELLRRPDVERVFYGLHSLDAPPSVDAFKLTMGFTAEPVRQRVCFHPLAAALAAKPTHGLVRLAARFAASPWLAKLEGLIRFHREGRQELALQSPPEILRAAGYRHEASGR